MKSKNILATTLGGAVLAMGLWKYESPRVTTVTAQRVYNLQSGIQSPKPLLRSTGVDPISIFYTSHPRLVPLVEKSDWWQKYQSGELNTETILIHLESLKQLEKFAEENPKFYREIQAHPLWGKAWTTDFFHTPEDDMELIENVLRHFEYFEENPMVKDILMKYGYAESDLFTSSWQDEVSIYTVLNDLNEIFAHREPAELERFFRTEIGKRCIEEKIIGEALMKIFEEFHRGKS